MYVCAACKFRVSLEVTGSKVAVVYTIYTNWVVLWSCWCMLGHDILMLHRCQQQEIHNFWKTKNQASLDLLSTGRMRSRLIITKSEPCQMCLKLLYILMLYWFCRVKHQGQKQYQCDICKKQFVAKCNLINHMWQHKNQRQRPFKCQLCNKAYLREALLEQHMRSHK